MPSAAPVTTPEPEELKHSANRALDSTGFEKILIKVQVDGGANATDFAGRTVQNLIFQTLRRVVLENTPFSRAGLIQ